MSYSQSSYEKQLNWSKMRQKELDAKRTQRKAEENLNNEPQFVSTRQKDFEGPAREINDRSSHKFIERMRKSGTGALSRKSSAQSIDVGGDLRSSMSYESSRRPVQIGGASTASAIDIVASYSGQFAQVRGSIADVDGESRDGSNNDDNSSDSDSGEPIIELLERERKQWASERDRLVQCIHLQQLEMSQRSLAAHERAMEIAKEFAKLVETFEQRIVDVEKGVQAELAGVRSVADTLLAAVNKLTTVNIINGQVVSGTGSTK